jgi:hypothetical protein
LSLKALKERAISSSYCGRKPEEYGKVWGAKMVHLFGGPLQDSDYAKASVSGKIASDIELFVQSHTDGAVTLEA